MAGSTAQRRSEAQPPWEEDGQANQHEAEFSRLRAALGLQRNNGKMIEPTASGTSS